MTFSRDEVALIRQGKKTAALALASSKIRAERTRPLRRRYKRHDEDGNEQGWATETVEDVTPGGERKPVILTILSVTDIPLDDLDKTDAEACGYRTLTDLKDAWRNQHPREPTVKLVRFAVGDLLDRDFYLSRPSRAGGDYTTNRHRAIDDLPVLSPALLAPITKQARENDRARSKHPDQILRDGLVRQLEEWELQTGGRTDRIRAQKIQGIRRQIAALDRELKAA